ncbi:uncharacterized protein LOC112501049 [Cynara cardunculus var. scolymus]|uniref:uncharacterized protein LOC112501049 n=1 Tax=Cynara cardunculus var. scolymus TaxID=59895 RepID=UPI000D62F8D1|nr:uncharacterized protein LOC112501049 [Cynara cardunculus var. scolymus]
MTKEEGDTIDVETYVPKGLPKPKPRRARAKKMKIKDEIKDDAQHSGVPPTVDPTSQGIGKTESNEFDTCHNNPIVSLSDSPFPEHTYTIGAQSDHTIKSDPVEHHESQKMLCEDSMFNIDLNSYFMEEDDPTPLLEWPDSTTSSDVITLMDTHTSHHQFNDSPMVDLGMVDLTSQHYTPPPISIAFDRFNNPFSALPPFPIYIPTSYMIFDAHNVIMPMPPITSSYTTPLVSTTHVPSQTFSPLPFLLLK